MGKLRVCVFCETWESGGIESFLTGVLSQLDPARLKIDLVASELRDSVFTRRLEERGVRFLQLSGSSRRLLSNWALFRRLLTENGYDVLYLNAYQALSLRYALLARRAGVPVRLLHSHNTGLRAHILRPLKLILHRMARSLYSGTGTAYFACSGEAAEFLFSPALRAKRSVRILFNGIDTERFRFRQERRKAVRARLGLDDRFVLGHVGRLCYQKNQMFLLEVLHALLPIRPESRLLLIGEGEQLAELEQRAERLGIREQVVFFGVTEKPEEMLWAMDAFLFPSRFEGLGIAAVEAQCAGLPTLCSEFVPAEALITDLAQRVPLASGAEAWAEAASELRIADSRAGYASAVRDAGFDAETVGCTLQEAMLASASRETAS